MTIKDIARAAGVSISTVSRILNGKTVRTGNKERVEKAIARYRFVPNFHARSLMRKGFKAAGLLITSMTNNYYLEIAEAFEKKLRDKGYMLLVGSTSGSWETERTYLEDYSSRGVEGTVVVDCSLENWENGFFRRLSRDMSVVLVHSNPEIVDINSIVIDQTMGMRKVMDYLWSQGHRDIAFLRGKTGYSYDIKEEAWRRFLMDRGVVPGPHSLLVIERGNTEEAVELAERVMIGTIGSRRLPQAVFACNDLMAIGVMNAALRNGIDVPGDLSVVGHDNTLLALSGRIRLTSVDLKMHALGEAAADLLLQGVERRDMEPRRVVFAPDLVIRESSGRARGQEAS
jgi:LacI family transcriptional regulator